MNYISKCVNCTRVDTIAQLLGGIGFTALEIRNAVSRTNIQLPIGEGTRRKRRNLNTLSWLFPLVQSKQNEGMKGCIIEIRTMDNSKIKIKHVIEEVGSEESH